LWLTVELSEKGKFHDRQCKVYNSQAADYVFRTNNARCGPDEIDLHGLYVEEAMDVFEIRIKACEQRHDDHLHVYVSLLHNADLYRIVGKGIHSLNHIQKLRPAIEKLCQKHQFKYYVEENEGRILVKFGEGAGHLSQGEAQGFWDRLQNFAASQGYPGQSQPQYQQPQQAHQQPHQGQQYHQQQQHHQNQGNQNGDLVEQVVKKAAPVVIRKLNQCCIIL
jgi:hypothetical protein